MRLDSFLIQEGKDFQHGEIVDLLVKDCMPYLKDNSFSSGKPKITLYSGRDSTDSFIDRKIRKDRYPKDTPIGIHNMLDDMFLKKFRTKARSQSLFVSGNRFIATGYGNEYTIFPKGKYRIIWSSKVQDLYIKARNLVSTEIGVDSYDIEWGDSIKETVKLSKDYEEYASDESYHKTLEEWNKKYGEGTRGGLWAYNHDLYDRNEIKKFGLKGKRSIFLKGMTKDQISDMLFDKYETNSGFGVFPESFEWIPDVTFEDYEDKVRYKYLNQAMDELISDTSDTITRGIQSLINTYKEGHLSDAVKSDSEIMLVADGYYGIYNSPAIINVIYHYFGEFGYKIVAQTIKDIGIDKWDKWKNDRGFIE